MPYSLPPPPPGPPPALTAVHPGTPPTESTFGHPQTPDGKSSRSHERGLALEGMVAKILQTEGFATDNRAQLSDRDGIRHELDIVATKGRLKLAIECKNHAPGRAVGIEEVRNFLYKLTRLSIPNGLFVAYDRLSMDAMELCQTQGVEVWDHVILKEKYIEAVAGRLETASEEVVPLALAPRVQLDSVSTVRLANPSLLRLASASLVFHPYVSVEYHLRFIGKDPSREEHRIADDGTLFFDGLTEDLVGACDQDGEDRNFEAVSQAETKGERKVLRMILGDLKFLKPMAHFRIARGPAFRLKILDAEVDETKLKTFSKDTVSEENEEVVTYRVHGGRSDGERKSHTFSPKPRHVELRDFKTIHVPFWDLRFEAGARTYSRRILASSGQVIEDQLALCPRHIEIGGFKFVKKPPTALCEVCGGAYCADHVTLAPDGRYYCDVDVPPQFKPTKRGFFGFGR